jgi:hypothetical protein
MRKQRHKITICVEGVDFSIKMLLSTGEVKFLKKVSNAFEEEGLCQFYGFFVENMSRKNCQYAQPSEKIKTNSGKKKLYHLCCEKPEVYCEYREILKIKRPKENQLKIQGGFSNIPICNRKFYKETQ